MKSSIIYLIVNKIFFIFLFTSILFFFGSAYAASMVEEVFVLFPIQPIAESMYPVLIFSVLGFSILCFYVFRRILFLDKKEVKLLSVQRVSIEQDINVMRVNESLDIESANKLETFSFESVLQQQEVSDNDIEAMLRMIKKQFKTVEFGLTYGDVHSKKNNQVNIYCISSKPVLNKKNKVIYVDVLWTDSLGQKKRIETLVGQAEHDHLTGLVNRMCFDKFMAAFPDNVKAGTKNVLCFIDIDNFKSVNDSAGHVAGDELLKQLADVFQQYVRSSDLLARIGGDEFVILFPDCSMRKARERFESIINHVSSLRFNWSDKSFVVSVSMGAVEFGSDVSNDDMQTLYKIADDACYTAKKKGRNQLYIHSFSDEVTSKKIENSGRDNWSEIIRNALDNNKFKLYVQPIIPLNYVDNDQKKRFEIYIRLPYKGRILRPGSFFPAAERAGLSRSIDRWVVRQVFSRLAKIKQDSPDDIAYEFTINLSVGSLLDDSFASFIGEQLNKYKLKAESMCFEVSESAVVSNFTHARKFLVKLSALGCRNSLDDFGSGLSALNYIRDLPIHYLKIDGVFVRNIEKNQIDAAMVHSLNHMSKVMNLKTVAEFVEDGNTARLLQRLGVNYAQGYYCGRPLPLEELEVSEKTALVLVK